MSMNHYAIFIKVAGFLVFLVPLVLTAMGFFINNSIPVVVLAMVIGTVLLTVGNIIEVKTMRALKKDDLPRDN